MIRAGLPTLLGIPYDAKSSFLRGAAAAPAEIRRALASPAGNNFTEDLVELTPGISHADAGDVALTDDAYPLAAIEAAVASIVAVDGRPLLLGGDHSITYPVLRALRRVHPRLTIVHFDAHNDLYDIFEGDRFSHACPFARIMEESLADRLVQIGTRTTTRHQRQQADRFGVEIVDMRRWHAGAGFGVQGPVYVSLDLDVLDPAFAPGVSHREPGGLSTRELIAALHGIRAPIVAADVVELNPVQDLDGITAIVAAKLVKELLAKMGADARLTGEGT
jgi:agmatinase